MHNSFEILGLLPQFELAETNKISLHWVPFVNLLTLALGITLLSSHWLCPPSLSLNLPKTSQSIAFTETYPTAATMTLDAEGRIFFNRKLYTQETFSQLFTKHFKSSALLFKVDVKAPLEIMMQIVSNAYQHGCQRIQIAVNFQD
ncbi:MAG: biopolymer transporter ExbD [Puniceicoccales bacterium]|jgi:biopolymer transport protein ExbD|nr:biopolymer transporter ExbD [Puniceicoccales bacterium]